MGSIEYKICSRCKIKKTASEFRMRYDKNGSGSRQKKYLNNTCRKCDSEISNLHYFKNKDNKKWYENWKKKSRDYHAAHSGEIKLKNKIYRSTKKYKAYMKAYRERRKDIIYAQEVITKKRYHEKNRDAITDKYVLNLLRTNGVRIPDDDALKNKLIEIKRGEVLLSRIKAKLNEKKKSK